MTVRKLPTADDYFMFSSGGQTVVGLTKNGICYRMDEGGALVPVIYGDEYAPVCSGRVAVRKGRSVRIL